MDGWVDAETRREWGEMWAWRREGEKGGLARGPRQGQGLTLVLLLLLLLLLLLGVYLVHLGWEHVGQVKALLGLPLLPHFLPEVVRMVLLPPGRVCCGGEGGREGREQEDK